MSPALDEGFTLIELLLVVLILGILLAIAIPTYLSLTSSARTNGAEANLNTAAEDEGGYLAQNGDFDGVSGGASAADNVSATATPPGMNGVDPGLNWLSTASATSLPAAFATSAGTKTILVYMPSSTGATAIVLGTAGQDGKFYWIYDNNGTLTYDYNSVGTAVPTTYTGWGSSWKMASNL